MKRAIIAVAAVLAWGGARQAKAVFLPVNSNTVIQEGIEYYIETDKAVYDLGEDVEIFFRITNLTDESIYLGTGAAFPFCCEYLVADSTANEVWHWPWLISRVGGLSLPQYGQLDHSVLWDMMNDNGTWLEFDDELVIPGIYIIETHVSVAGGDVSIPPPVSLSVEIIPEPTSLALFVIGGVCFRKIKGVRYIFLLTCGYNSLRYFDYAAS